ncbi:MAG: hypothetical protein F6J94_03925 [Moorea sp. SIO1F2]|nr:hypothetical protein [Moorena sp. SIO1F2]
MSKISDNPTRDNYQQSKLPSGINPNYTDSNSNNKIGHHPTSLNYSQSLIPQGIAPNYTDSSSNNKITNQTNSANYQQSLIPQGINPNYTDSSSNNKITNQTNSANYQQSLIPQGINPNYTDSSSNSNQPRPTTAEFPLVPQQKAPYLQHSDQGKLNQGNQLAAEVNSNQFNSEIIEASTVNSEHPPTLPRKASSQSKPTIQVTIGSIDVRASKPPAPPRRTRSINRASSLSLKDYLKHRNGGR